MSGFQVQQFSDLVDVTDYVANGSFASLRENVRTSSEPDFAILVRLVDHNSGWSGPFSYVDQPSYQFLKKTKLEPGDIIIANVGANAGTVFRVPELSQPSTLGPNSVLCRPRDKEKLNRGFLYYLLLSPIGQALLSGIISGSAQPKFNKTSLRQLPLSVPSIDEQRAIAEVLGALDDKIAANTKMGHTLEALGSAQFTRLGLDVEPCDKGILLGDLFDLNPRRTVVSDSPTIIDMKALPTDRPLVEEWTTGARKGGTRFKNGDTLVARITPCLENRKTAFVDFLDETDVGIGSTEFIVMRSKEDLPLGVSYFMAISQRFRDFAIQNMVGTSGRQRVAAADLARHTLSPVDTSELQEFGKRADDSLKFLGSLREENLTLAATRDALLPQLLSGKLKVKDVEKALEDAL